MISFSCKNCGQKIKVPDEHAGKKGKCPKCGNENPEITQTCSWCGQVLANEASTKTKPKIRIRSLILFALVAFVLIILCVLSVLVSYLTVLLIIIYGIHRTVKIIKNEQVKGKVYVVALLAILDIFLVCTILWRLDAPPIHDDYTIADLRSAGAESSNSYIILSSLADKDKNTPDAPGIGLSQNDVDMIGDIYNIFVKEADNTDHVVIERIKAKSEIINQIWEKAKKGREVINKLSRFEEIADLTQLDMFADISFLGNLRNLEKLYILKIWLECEQGDPRIAVREIIKFDSVVRKLSVNARTLLTKMVCYSCLNMNIRTANFIINNPKASQETVRLLAEHFVPLSNDQVSLQNTFVYEYLVVSKGLREELVRELPILRFMRNVPFLKWNSTLRVYRNYWDEQLDIVGESNGLSNRQFSVWPEIYPDLSPMVMDSNGEFLWYYKSYNPVGTILLAITLPSLHQVFEEKTVLEVQDDLLQIILNKRLGKQINLKAQTYSNEYIIDQDTKIIFSPGPDGQAYTEDDIKLSIDSEVIGF